MTLSLSKEYNVLSSEAFSRDIYQTKVKQEAGIQDGDSHVFQGQLNVAAGLSLRMPNNSEMRWHNDEITCL